MSYPISIKREYDVASKQIRRELAVDTFDHDPKLKYDCGGMEYDENGEGDYMRTDDIYNFMQEIFECWTGKIGLSQMSAYDIVESIENVVQQRLPGFDAYASTPK